MTSHHTYLYISDPTPKRIHSKRSNQKQSVSSPCRMRIINSSSGTKVLWTWIAQRVPATKTNGPLCLSCCHLIMPQATYMFMSFNRGLSSKPYCILHINQEALEYSKCPVVTTLRKWQLRVLFLG